MMLNSCVPKSFLGEVVMAAYYLTNMTHSVALNGDISYEIWYGKCVDYVWLNCFLLSK